MNARSKPVLRENPNGFSVDKPEWASQQWGQLIPLPQWMVYKAAIQAARSAQVPFMLGGAFGLARYTGRWRNTKDIDFFVREADGLRLIEALLQAGFSDYHEQLAYDRSWIYRAVQDDVIVDVIWTTPNHHMVVDEDWFQHARGVTIQDEELQVIPAEELLWIKTFVMQRDRCDWPDLVNLLAAAGPDLQWDRLLARFGDDAPLLHSVLLLFSWVCPDGAAQLPQMVRERFSLPGQNFRLGDETEKRRVALLDSRPWYAAFQPADAPMRL